MTMPAYCSIEMVHVMLAAWTLAKLVEEYKEIDENENVFKAL